MVDLCSSSEEKFGMDKLLEIMVLLRSPDGCPWDREQDHKSIRANMIEEAYETADAIDRESKVDLCEELGDVLMQVVFHSRIAQENGEFDFSDVTDGICRKLILRHPHVFGDVKVRNSDDVLNNWDAIKKEEKHQQSYTDTLRAVPSSFPALMRAQKVAKRAAKAGFEWSDVFGPIDKIGEETKELIESINSGDKDKILQEYGDLLFSVANVARYLDIDAEEALFRATDKFINRFANVEHIACESKKDMKDVSAEQLDIWWNEAKNNI